MNKNLEILINVILDNRDEPIEVIVKKLEEGISKCIPFNHKANNLLDACAQSNFNPDLNLLLSNEPTSDSKQIEKLESFFTKRQLAMLVYAAESMAIDTASNEKHLSDSELMQIFHEIGRDTSLNASQKAEKFMNILFKNGKR